MERAKSKEMVVCGTKIKRGFWSIRRKIQDLNGYVDNNILLNRSGKVTL
jgi:hypothetical protein